VSRTTLIAATAFGRGAPMEDDVTVVYVHRLE
jgi:hypothetical protein